MTRRQTRQRGTHALSRAILATTTAACGLMTHRASADPLADVQMFGWNITQQGPAPSNPNAYLPAVQVNPGDTVVYALSAFLSPVGTKNISNFGYTITSKVEAIDGINSLMFDAYQLTNDQIQVDFRNTTPPVLSTTSGATVSPGQGVSLTSGPTGWSNIIGANGGTLGHPSPANVAGARSGPANDLLFIRPGQSPGTFRGLTSSRPESFLGTGLFVVSSTGSGALSTTKMRYIPVSQGGGGAGFQFNNNGGFNAHDTIITSDLSEAGSDPFTGYAGLTLTTSSVITWKNDVSGNWSQSSNWTSSIPNGPGAQAFFGPVATQPREISVDSPTTVGSLTFASLKAYTVNAPGPLTLTAGGSPGTLTINAGSHAIASPVAIPDGLNVTTTAGSAVTMSGSISGTAGISVSGAGKLVLTGSNTFTGGLIINSGAANINSDAALGDPSSPLQLGLGGLQLTANIQTNRNIIAFGPDNRSLAGAYIDTNGFNATLAGQISGTGGLIKIGDGTLALRGSNTYSGDTLVLGGTVDFNSSSNFGSASAGLHFSGTTLKPQASIVIPQNIELRQFGSTIDTNNCTLTLAGNISFATYGVSLGVTALTKAGSGTLVLTGSNDLGPIGEQHVAVNAGILRFANSASSEVGNPGMILVNAGAAAGASMGSYNLSPFRLVSCLSDASVGALALAPSDATRNIDVTVNVGLLNQVDQPLLNMSIGALDTLTYTGTIIPNPSLGYRLGGGGTLIMASPNALTGSRNLTITNAGTVVLNSSNNFTGNIAINLATTLSIKSDNALGNGLNPLSFDTGGSLQFASSFNLSPNRAVGLNSGGGTIDTQANSTTIAHAITGSGSLTKSGTGTLILTGSNTYTGGTNVLAGTLINNGSSQGNISASSGGKIQGSGTYSGQIAINSGGILSPGNSPGTITSSSGAMNSDGAYLFDIRDATGSPGTGTDYWHILNQLNITANAANPFIITPDTLNLSNLPGLADHFNPNSSYSWILAQADTGITGFSPSAFAIDPGQFQNNTNGGSFSVSQSGNDLLLNFTPVPEPASTLLVLPGAIILFIRRRRT